MATIWRFNKTKDDKDIKEISIAKEHSKNCPCNKDVNPPRGGGSRGLGAGATSIQGAGHSAQISEEKKDDTGVSAESLGNPEQIKKAWKLRYNTRQTIINEMFQMW